MNIKPIFKTINDKKVILRFDSRGRLTDETSCTCKWGSFYRWSKANKEKKWICRHLVKAYAKIIKQTYKNAREILIKQGILDPNHIQKE